MLYESGLTGFQTIQNRASFWGGITESPCKACTHASEDKNKCKLLPDCPIRIPTIFMMSTPKQGNPPKYKNVCQFPGCKKPCKNTYCSGKKGHAQLVWIRKKRHPDRPDLWHVPVKAGGWGNNLEKRLETLKKDGEL